MRLINETAHYIIEYNYENLALNSSRLSTGPNSFEGSIEMKLSKL